MSTLTVEAALHHHRQGDLAKAETLYRQILATHPHHADALHLLGMLMHQSGNNAEAESLIRSAISIQPAQSVYHSNLGLILAATGRLSDAISEHQIAAQLDPQSAQTANNLGVALHANGDITSAIDCFKRAVILQPDYPDARINLLVLLNLDPAGPAGQHALGDLLHEANRSADAIQFYRNAIDLNPQSAQSHNNLGNALFACGTHEEALRCYEQALVLNPEFPQAINNRANALKELDRPQEAIAAYAKATELQPLNPSPLSNLGNAWRDAGHWDAAMRCYGQALKIDPDHAATHSNIGNAWCERGQWSTAITAYEKALQHKHDYADAINNMGTALEELGHRDRAMDCYLRALQLAPKLLSPPWNIALLQLLRGDYENGWPGYEHRWQQKKQCRARRNFAQPMVQHISQIKGSRILLHAEQGFGDAIQFCRYAILIAQIGATVMLECPPKLARLFTSLPGLSVIIARGHPLPDFDLHCPLMSLPMIFQTRLDSVPLPTRYLHPDKTNSTFWQTRLQHEPNAFRVGLVWAGQSSHQKDRHRSLPLAAFAPLANIPNTQFYSLQIGDPSNQAKLPPAGFTLIDWTADLQDFADTAALIDQLDLVITVDTAVCHLAGALGKHVWILIAFQPDWRWLLDRTDSPWYSTAKLFRQSTPDDWSDPLAKVFDELATQVQRDQSPTPKRPTNF